MLVNIYNIENFEYLCDTLCFETVSFLTLFGITFYLFSSQRMLHLWAASHQRVCTVSAGPQAPARENQAVLLRLQHTGNQNTLLFNLSTRPNIKAFLSCNVVYSLRC